MHEARADKASTRVPLRRQEHGTSLCHCHHPDINIIMNMLYFGDLISPNACVHDILFFRPTQPFVMHDVHHESYTDLHLHFPNEICAIIIYVHVHVYVQLYVHVHEG